jgi:hypothetical protein
VGGGVDPVRPACAALTLVEADLMNSRRLTCSLLLSCVALLVASAARADDPPDISFKKRGDNEKNFVKEVGKAIIKAAHGTAKKIDLLKYEYTEPKANRKELAIKMEYHGAVTGKRYVADIVVKIDSSDKDSWEVLNIDYVDTNTGVKHNEKKVQELIKELNKK